MGSYIPSTPPERRQMLDTIGLESMEDLFAQIPEGMKMSRLNLPEGKPEQEVIGAMESIAGKNRIRRRVECELQKRTRGGSNHRDGTRRRALAQKHPRRRRAAGGDRLGSRHV